MIESILKSFEVWSDAQGVKSKGRVKSIDNISLEGISRLRELIFELAITGKLVPQDSNDEPATEMLKRIEIEKIRLANDKKVKTVNTFSELQENEIPFILPNGWVWTKIRNIGHDWGQTIPSETFTYIDVSAIDNKKGVLKSPTILEASVAPSRARKIVKQGSVVYATVRPYLNNNCVVSENLSPKPIASTAFAVLHPYLEIDSRYILLFLRSPLFIKYVESEQVGIAYPAINDKQFFGGLFPLPPFAEQNRIVDKVEELMAVCDKLEEEKTNNLKTHQYLVSCLLETLSNSFEAEALQTAWERISQQFDTLFCTEDSVDQLKETILQLTISGKLVKQNVNDEPASILLNRIKSEREKLIAEGELKKETSLPVIADAEKPFTLPNGWEWVRLQQIIQISSGDGLTASSMNSNGNIPVFGGNGINGYHDKANISKPSLVIGRVGFYCGSIHITPSSAWVTDNAFITTFSEENISIKFLYWLLKGTNLKENDNATAQPVISGRKVYPLVVAIPPLNEQIRIVKKIEELYAICDLVRVKIEKAQEVQTLLSETIVASVL